jgi:exodeoxyribonuclease VII small subunit
MKKFEERLARLEELAETIRKPDLALEEAVAVFEEGVKLSKGLEKDLQRIEGRVEILLNQPAGSVGTMIPMAAKNRNWASLTWTAESQVRLRLKRSGSCKPVYWQTGSWQTVFLEPATMPFI